MKIEFLYFDGCPSHENAEQFLNEVLAETQTQARVEKKNITSYEKAVFEKFLGSPSIRIDGVDIDPIARTSSDYGLKCRIYKPTKVFSVGQAS